VGCTSCHKSVEDVALSYTVYRGTPLECAACHDQ
jgi:hypothetical protein